MNRGSPLMTIASAMTVRRFNEAPIHESGKWTGTTILHSVGTRFNEAPIHESGKCGHATVLAVDRAQASMRPRFMNRGSVGCDNLEPEGLFSFNEAPIHESGK